MKIRVAVLVLAGAVLALWIAHSNATRSKKIEARNTVADLAENRASAKAVLLAACTNAVPGIHSVVEVSIDDSADRVSAWKGRATLDYINSAGGIDRTNLHFVFATPYGDMMCVLDAAWINQVDDAQFKRRLESASAGSQ